MTEIPYHKLEALLQTAGNLNSSFNIRQLMPLIMLGARDLLECELSSLYLLEEEEEYLFCEISVGPHKNLIQEYRRVEIGEGGPGRVAREKSPVLVNDPEADPDPVLRLQSEGANPVRNILCVPLFIREALIGVLEVQNKKIGGFTDTDREVLISLADIAATALNNSRLHENLKKRILELALLQELEKGVSSNADLESLSAWILDKCLEVLESRSGALLIWESREQLLHLVASRSLSPEPPGNYTLSITDGLVGYAIRSGKALLVRDFKNDPLAASVTLLPWETNSQISAPILYNEQLLGAISVQNKASGFSFDKSDFDLLTPLTTRIGISIRNLQLSDQVNRSEREQIRARSLMNTLISEELPVIPGLEIALKYQLIEQIGGDFFKFFPISHHRVGVLIADVCGHGLSAALMVMMVLTAISTFESRILECPGDFFHQLNRILLGLMASNFLTAFYCIIDFEENSITYANGGHQNPVIHLREKGTILTLKARGSVIGVFPDLFFEERTIEFRPGDRLLLYTDGLVEHSAPGNDSLIGDEQLCTLVRERGNLDCQEMIHSLLTELDDYFQRREAHDDITVLVLDRHLSE